MTSVLWNIVQMSICAHLTFLYWTPMQYDKQYCRSMRGPRISFVIFSSWNMRRSLFMGGAVSAPLSLTSQVLQEFRLVGFELRAQLLGWEFVI